MSKCPCFTDNHTALGPCETIQYYYNFTLFRRLELVCNPTVLGPSEMFYNNELHYLMIAVSL